MSHVWLSKGKQTWVGEDNNLNLKSKVYFEKLPPCASSLGPHVNRVNHRLAHIKRSHVAIFDAPNPTDGQGWVMDDGLMEQMWTYGLLFPQSQSPVDLMASSYNSEQSEEDEIYLDNEDIIEYMACDKKHFFALIVY